MNGDLLVSVADLEVFALILEGFVVVDLAEFFIDGFLSQIILIGRVQFHCLVIVAWNFTSTPHM